MPNIVNAELKHLKDTVRLGLEYYSHSRFHNTDLEPETEVFHDILKSCLVAPNVMLQVLVDEDNKVHGMVQASLVPMAWSKKLNCAINLIYVDKCCKGKGYAEQFLTNVKEWATANNCYELIAGDYAMDFERTAKWYAKHGYTTVGQQYAIKI